MRHFRQFKINLQASLKHRVLIPTTLLLGVLLVFVVRGAGPALKESYTIGLDLQSDGCLPYVLYGMKAGRVDNRAEESKKIQLRRGMFVSFVSKDLMMGLDMFDGRRIVKKVAGLPGDVLKVENDKVYVNGVHWGGLALLGTLGKEKGAFDREEVVPEGKVLLLGTLKNSYDGRYYGFIDQSAIDAQAMPLL